MSIYGASRFSKDSEKDFFMAKASREAKRKNLFFIILLKISINKHV